MSDLLFSLYSSDANGTPVEEIGQIFASSQREALEKGMRMIPDEIGLTMQEAEPCCEWQLEWVSDSLIRYFRVKPCPEMAEILSDHSENNYCVRDIFTAAYISSWKR
jgi:hypothetical protein